MCEITLDRSEPKVSIIINCFNGARFLKYAIESVLSQTYRNWELIFWDNQSTDSSANIFQAYKDARFFYYYAERHTSLGEARNLAVALSNGDWISFLDCDDLWSDSKLEIQMEVVDRDSGGMLGFVYGNTEYFEEGDEKNIYTTLDLSGYKSLPEGDIFHELCKSNFVSLVSGLIRRNSFNKVGGFSNKLKQSEDYEIFLKVSKIFLVGAVNEICCYYRRHESNLSNSQQELNFIESIDILSCFIKDPIVLKSISLRRGEYIVWALIHSKYSVVLREFSEISFVDFLASINDIFLRNIRKKLYKHYRK